MATSISEDCLSLLLSECLRRLVDSKLTEAAEGYIKVLEKREKLRRMRIKDGDKENKNAFESDLQSSSLSVPAPLSSNDSEVESDASSLGAAQQLVRAINILLLKISSTAPAGKEFTAFKVLLLMLILYHQK
jgi:hypothetical protein